MMKLLIKRQFYNHLVTNAKNKANPGILEGKDIHQLGTYGIDKFTDVTFLDESEDSRSIELALQNSKKWQEAADSEFKSLTENDTLYLVELPRSRNPVGCKWVFRTKYGGDGEVQCYKAQLNWSEGLDSKVWRGI